MWCIVSFIFFQIIQSSNLLFIVGSFVRALARVSAKTKCAICGWAFSLIFLSCKLSAVSLSFYTCTQRSAIRPVRDCGRITYQGTRKIEAGYKPSHTTDTLIGYTACCVFVLYFDIFLYQTFILSILPDI